MATRSAQTQAKRARELALREKRERKREKKAEAAARRAEAAETGGTPVGPTDGLIDQGANRQQPELDSIERAAVVPDP